MPRQTNIVTISIPKNLTRTMNSLSKQTDQTRSELVRNALRAYFLDMADDRERFLEVYRSTRKQKKMSMADLRKKYGLD